MLLCQVPIRWSSLNRCLVCWIGFFSHDQRIVIVFESKWRKINDGIIIFAEFVIIFEKCIWNTVEYSVENWFQIEDASYPKNLEFSHSSCHDAPPWCPLFVGQWSFDHLSPCVIFHKPERRRLTRQCIHSKGTRTSTGASHAQHARQASKSSGRYSY